MKVKLLILTTFLFGIMGPAFSASNREKCYTKELKEMCQKSDNTKKIKLKEACEKAKRQKKSEKDIKQACNKSAKAGSPKPCWKYVTVGQCKSSGGSLTPMK